MFQSQRIQGDYSPDYFDIQAGITWKPDVKNEIRILGITGRSRYSLVPDLWSIRSKTSDIYTIGMTGRESFGYRPACMGVDWKRTVSNKLQTRIHGSVFHQEENEDTRLEYGGSDLTEENDESLRVETYQNHLDVTHVRSLIEGMLRLRPGHRIRFGIEGRHYRLGDRRFEQVHDANPSPIDPLEQIDSSRTLESAGFSAYAQYAWKPWPKLSVRSGLRFTQHQFNKERLLLPRIHLTYHLSERTDIFLAAGRYAQPPLYKEFRGASDSPMSRLKAQKSNQITLGFERRWAGGFNFRAEAYYKRLQDVISYELLDVRMIYSGRNDAAAYAYGLDAHLRGEIVPDCLGWISYGYLVARENLIDTTGAGTSR
jgi:outer membrane receptor protein involved in Fe transport